MHLSVHVLDVPGLVLVTTPDELVVVVPTDLEAESLAALGSLLLSDAERAAVERALCSRRRSRPGSRASQRRAQDSE
jgi:hypothetical protein